MTGKTCLALGFIFEKFIGFHYPGGTYPGFAGHIYGFKEDDFAAIKSVSSM